MKDKVLHWILLDIALVFRTALVRKTNAISIKQLWLLVALCDTKGSYLTSGNATSHRTPSPNRSTPEELNSDEILDGIFQDTPMKKPLFENQNSRD
ncbi:hypothetical protein CEXT_629541 [Caerostris extrusa]|uniref:Secreted protein n=1 Tax=Caerostris extrusa TaxID=172846 RepID=A0AAV4MFG9_CAEEX|nr:hypothetical protein CEXT_629541 [Caerostris extrusa]